MAQYQHLPIYKLTYDVLVRVMTATKDFPREYKYTLGQNMKDEIIELVVLIYRANNTALKQQSSVLTSEIADLKKNIADLKAAHAH